MILCYTGSQSKIIEANKIMMYFKSYGGFDAIKQNYIVLYTSLAKYLCNTNLLTSLANALKGRGVLVLEADAKGQEQQPGIAEVCALVQVMLLCTSVPSSENEANNTCLPCGLSITGDSVPTALRAIFTNTQHS